MRRNVIVMSLMLLLAPLAAARADSSVVVRLAYLGQGQFLFKKTTYDYMGLVQGVQADYAGEHIDLVVVNMGQVASVNDR